MPRTDTSTAVPTQQVIADRWHMVEQMIVELTELGAGESSEEFWRSLVERAVRATNAAAAVVWQRRVGGGFELVEPFFRDAVLSLDRGGWAAVQREGLRRIRDQACSCHISGSDIAAGLTQNEDIADDPAKFQLICVPIMVDQQLSGALQLIVAADCSKDVVTGQLRFIETLAEIAADHLQGCQLRQFRSQSEHWQQQLQWIKTLHTDLNVESVAYALVNDGKQLIECGRLSLAMERRGRWQLVAVSGVDVVQRAATDVRLLERVCERIAATGEAVWYAGDAGELPPQLEEVLVGYADHAHLQSIYLLPISDAAVLVVENFVATARDRLVEQTQFVAEHAKSAVENAMQFESFPMAKLWRRWSQTRSVARARRWKVAAIASLLAPLLLAVIPAPLSISVSGRLQPLVRRDVFVPMNGVVAEVMVEHGNSVNAGALLAKMTATELEAKHRLLTSELATAESELKLIKSTRVQRTFDRNVDEVAEQRALSARKQELTYRVDGLRAQVALAEKQRNELAIVSPIGGQVVTWDLDRLLSGRPVQRGETLMTVADTRGLWVVELEVPDDQIGHLLATGKRDTLVDVRFVLESDPGTVCHGTMREMALVAEQAGGNGASVMVTVDVDVESLPRRFPGATVDASIHCGTRSVGYVWFRQVIEWARRKLWI